VIDVPAARPGQRSAGERAEPPVVGHRHLLAS